LYFTLKNTFFERNRSISSFKYSFCDPVDSASRGGRITAPLPSNHTPDHGFSRGYNEQKLFHASAAVKVRS
jgi:hypothetical protein